jgi:hypothetical protein
VSALKVQSDPALTELQHSCVTAQTLHSAVDVGGELIVPPFVELLPAVEPVPPVADDPAVSLGGGRCQRERRKASL